MAYPKGKARPKNAGRKKGTPNKVTLDAIEELQRMGHEPIIEHVRIFNQAMASYNAKKKKNNDYGAASCLDVAVRANAEIMKYIYPTRKAVEHTGQNGEPLFKSLTDFIVHLDDDLKDDDET
jgi:hypothetical protein